MDILAPPQLAAAQAQLEAVIEQLEKRKMDLLAAPWAEIERPVIKMLGGAFKINQPEHQAVALKGALASESSRFHCDGEVPALAAHLDDGVAELGLDGLADRLVDVSHGRPYSKVAPRSHLLGGDSARAML